MATTTQTVKVDLPAEIFDVQTSVPLLHQVVVGQLAAARQGTHKVKTRSEVSGTGAKPFKQKGTGRARQGSNRAPHMTGGAIVHGPTPRDYGQRTPKKMKAAALRGALSDRARNDRIHVVNELVAGTKPSTKSAITALAAVSDRKNLLVVIERANDVAALSLRNLEEVHTIYVDQLNTYDVLVADDVIFTQAAYEAFVAGPTRGKGATAVATSDEAATVAAEAAPAEAAPAEAAPAETAPAKAAADAGQQAGSAAPLEDGSAPEGFAIKGNNGSKKYHVPGSRWYENTTAEIWFQDVNAAKAAGFVPAGGEAAQATEEDAK